MLPLVGDGRETAARLDEGGRRIGFGRRGFWSASCLCFWWTADLPGYLCWSILVEESTEPAFPRILLSFLSVETALWFGHCSGNGKRW